MLLDLNMEKLIPLQLGLKEYAEEVLDHNMEKPDAIAISDQEKRDLERGQVGYAIVDTYMSYRLGERSSARYGSGSSHCATPSTPCGA